jgi:hypothetical protein
MRNPAYRLATRFALAAANDEQGQQQPRSNPQSRLH